MKEKATKTGENTTRDKALASAMGDIEKAYGKGAIMRLGEAGDLIKEIEGIGTGSITLDLALGGISPVEADVPELSSALELWG